jgi:hypothetical protein
VKLQDLSNIAQIAGPILVIISFGFIWFQLREGVRLARAEHARSLAEHAASFNSLLIGNGELAQLWYSYGKSLEPNTSAYLQYREMLVQWLIFHENMYYQKKRKLLDNDIYEGWQRDLEVTVTKHNITVIGTSVEDVFPGEFGRHLKELHEKH